MLELLAGLVPGLTADDGHARSSPAPTASRSTPSRPSGCSSPTAASARSTDGRTSRSASSASWRCPETLQALIAARLDGLARRGPGAPPGRRGARPELHPRRPGRGDRADDPRRSSRGCACLADMELRRPEGGPSLAGARPVRVRPGADPRGRLRHAGASATGGPDTSPRPASSNRSARTSWPAPSPRTTWPPTRPSPDGPEGDALAVQARLALVGAADRADCARLTGAGDRRS